MAVSRSTVRTGRLAGTECALGDADPGFLGEIVAVEADPAVCRGVDTGELERRLLELGFVEGARVRVLHQGFIRRDPIAVRVDDTTVAIRRRDARAVRVRTLA